MAKQEQSPSVFIWLKAIRSRFSGIISLRSKRFRAVSEQGTRNESQRPREKMGRVKERGGGGGGLSAVFFLPLPPLSFLRSRSIFYAAKTENPVPRSAFARPKPDGNASYAGYDIFE